VAPGQYDLALMVVPFNDARRLTVTGVVGGPLTLEIPRKDDPLRTLRITASGDRPVIGIQLNDDYGHFRWIRCVQTLEPPQPNDGRETGAADDRRKGESP
jgi:hypothetical protein